MTQEGIADINIRKDALNWWRNMDTEEQVNKVVEWKFSNTSSPQKHWSFSMIHSSTSSIERVYRELILKETFEN